MISSCNILKEFPQSGQKQVVLADHPDFGKIIIKTGDIDNLISLERIKREVDLLSEIDSIFYPKQYLFNIDLKSKRFEIVEEYIEGKTLRECADNFKTKKDIFELLLKLVDGLNLIWSEGIVHRDLKPENLIIRPNNMPCIIDLGIARFLQSNSLTISIAPYGPCTPIYASPEQLTNKKQLIDHRTDFFALGIICLELYLGIHPFVNHKNDELISIVDNIMQNLYVTSTDLVPEDLAITEFANNTLQFQPYNRFRNQYVISKFLKEQI